MDTLEGVVARSTGSWYAVLHGSAVYRCRARGRIRLKGVRTTNPIAVGDRVHFTLEGEAQGIITEIAPRRNYIIRRATNLSRETHIIAANLDLAAVVYTSTAPLTPLEFVDRVLATAQAYRIPGLLVLNKQDLLAEREAAHRMGLRGIYEHADYRVLELSTITGQGCAELEGELKGKTTLLAGASGVGKSSILNMLCPSLSLRTAPLSDTLNLGQHTTTFSEMHALDMAPDTYLIDTPGIKGFGVVDFQPEEVSHFFPEIFRLSSACRFTNCQHEHEPGCAVLAALDCGEISPSRYDSYVSLLHDQAGKYRRGD